MGIAAVGHGSPDNPADRRAAVDQVLRDLLHVAVEADGDPQRRTRAAAPQAEASVFGRMAAEVQQGKAAVSLSLPHLNMLSKPVGSTKSWVLWVSRICASVHWNWLSTHACSAGHSRLSGQSDGKPPRAVASHSRLQDHNRHNQFTALPQSVRFL